MLGLERDHCGHRGTFHALCRKDQSVVMGIQRRRIDLVRISGQNDLRASFRSCDHIADQRLAGILRFIADQIGICKRSAADEIQSAISEGSVFFDPFSSISRLS